MATKYGPTIVTDGLVLCLDAGNSQSYPGSGTTWTDLSGNGYDFTLTNSPTFGTHNGTSCFSFSASDDYATRAGSITHDIGSACTLTVIMASISNSNFGSCSRLFSVNSGSGTGDHSSWVTLASCNESKYGLWYKNDPSGLYPSSVLKTTNDDYFIVTYKWTATLNAYVLVNGELESTHTGVASAFDYTGVGRMTIGMNSSLTQENAYVRVAAVFMYDRELSTTEVLHNYNAHKGRYGL